VLRTYPREGFLRAMSFVSVPGLIGPLVGPTLGGWLAQAASWHWIFLINIPVGVLGCIATYAYMPDSRNPDVARFDLVGYALLAFGMAAISLSIDGLSELGLRHATVLVLLVFGLSGLTSYWLRSVRQPSPLFSLDLFKVHTFTVGVLGNLFARIGSGAMPFLIPLLLQLTMGYSPLQAGLTMIPVAVAGIFSKQMGTTIISRAGYRRILVNNTILLGVSMASFAFTSPAQPFALLVLQLAFFGAVNSLQFTAMNTVTLKDLDLSLASSGNSLLSMTMMLSMSLGVAAAGGLLGAFDEVFRNTSASRSLNTFHATFACIGLITCASAWIFWQLAPDAKERVPEPQDVRAD
jgi:MFS family permease